MIHWNVYIENFNRRCIEVIDLLEPRSYLHGKCIDALKECGEDKESFAEEIRKAIMY